jgi:L-seryl-tRNA(Ser) seleniumtransferase
VVNNAAGSWFYLACLASVVVISRAQLVEIGGVSILMCCSNRCTLHEVGTTNRVHLADYTTAIKEASPALVLHAHRSNFRITGFTSEPSLSELAEISHQAVIPLVDDLGSGALLDTAPFGLEQAHRDEAFLPADLVCFSGDKLLGAHRLGSSLAKGVDRQN